MPRLLPPGAETVRPRLANSSKDRRAKHIVCVSCGKTQVDSPFEGGDYFDVIM